MTHTTAVPIKGVDIELGGTVYTVPPITLGALERVRTQLESIEGTGRPADFAAVIDVVLPAMQRNYPDMQREQLIELIDLGTMNTVMAAVMGRKLPDGGTAAPIA